jgi:hypothetical protein
MIFAFLLFSNFYLVKLEVEKALLVYIRPALSILPKEVVEMLVDDSIFPVLSWKLVVVGI